MEFCDVCCEKFNKSNHKRVICPFCDLNSCRKCSQKYLISVPDKPHCMGCKHEHNRELVSRYCSALFVNRELKKHRENVLFECEKARLPETQKYVKRELEMRSLRTTYIYMYYILTNIYRIDELDVHAKSSLKDVIRHTMHNDIYDKLQILRNNDISNDTNVRLYSIKCPDNTCRGFLDDDRVCGICKMSFCKHCNERDSPNHKCDNNLVKTLKMINRDTKPCPRCNAPIYKIEGCSQMWCTQCHVTFDWKTGFIETGRIHNPHYFEFKKRGREHGDIPCGGCPTYRELLSIDSSNDILNISSTLINLTYELTYKFAFEYEDNIHLRMKYLLNEISEKNVKKELQRRDKHNEKTSDIRDIYNMYIDTVSDLLRQYVLDRTKEFEILCHINELTAYTNCVLSNIRNIYRCRIPCNIMLDLSI